MTLTLVEHLTALVLKEQFVIFGPTFGILGNEADLVMPICEHFTQKFGVIVLFTALAHCRRMIFDYLLIFVLE